MKALVFGRSGQLAKALAALAGGGTFAPTCFGRDGIDLSAARAGERIAEIVARGGWDAVINAAAWTAVDLAEREEDEARRLNADAPAAMARATAAAGIPFVQVSTDYVFDGSGVAPWRPEAIPAPLSAYGRSKLEGEELVRACGGVHAILRTAWVFSAHGGNFVTSMLQLSRSRDRLGIVADQVGGPTPAAALAAACATIARGLAEDPSRTGTYHFAGAPDVSRADFARAIFAAAGRDVTVDDIASRDYPTPAARPLNSRLDCESARRVFGLSRPDWRDGLARVLGELQSETVR